MLRTNDIWALDWITGEEDRPIEANNIVVTLPCVQLDGEASRIPGEIGELAAKGDGAEAKEERCLLPNLAQKVGLQGFTESTSMDRACIPWCTS